MKQESGGLLLLRRITPLPRRNTVYFCSGAYNSQNSGFQLANATPVDPGIIWSTSGPVEILPCLTPIVTAPNIFNPKCNGYLSYSQVGRPRNFMPTERLQFQSSYFKNFETSGSLGYSSSDNVVPDFNEIVNDYVTRNGTRGGTTGGPATAKRVSVNADWSGTYAVTDKFRIIDSFRYDNWRIPGFWDFAETSIFGQLQPGLVGLAQPQALFNSATFLSICPAPYTAVTTVQGRLRKLVRAQPDATLAELQQQLQWGQGLYLSMGRM